MPEHLQESSSINEQIDNLQAYYDHLDSLSYDEPEVDEDADEDNDPLEDVRQEADSDIDDTPF